MTEIKISDCLVILCYVLFMFTCVFAPSDSFRFQLRKRTIIFGFLTIFVAFVSIIYLIYCVVKGGVRFVY